MSLFKKLFKRKKMLNIGTRIPKTAKVDKHSKVGKYCYIGDYTFVTRATIGNYCSIANFVTIGPGEHNLNNISTNTLFEKPENIYDALTEKECIIGNDVWIGVGAIIRRGVKIGNGAIIGANSFVNKDVPDFAIVAGSPARILRFRFPEDVCNEITKSQWWNKDLDEAKEIMKKIEK